MKIRNILWDADGALFNTYPAITFSLSKVLTNRELSVPLNVIDRLVRLSIDHCLETLSQRFKLELNLLRLQFADAHRTVSPSRQPPFPGAYNICEFISKYGGANIAFTKYEQESTQLLLDAHELSTFFLGVINAKQRYPGMIEAALARYCLEPNETLLIGEQALDIQAGQIAGVRTCLFGEQKTATKVDMHITRYSELFQYLNK